MRYKITLAYDGAPYCGWQVQAGSLSIQALVQRALCTVLRHPVDVTGSGRTDAGVHARGQTAHFDSGVVVDVAKLRLALNGLLPEEIRVLEVGEVEAGFHARYSAVGKEYHYYLHTDRVADPFVRKFRWHVLKRMDLNLLRQAAREFIGEKDFTSFANEPKRGAAAKDPVRHLWRLDVGEIDGGVRLEFEADGFLYKMVRNLTGTLVECAAGSVGVEEIRDILEAKDRRRAFATAPPQGLFLMRVQYPEKKGNA